MTIPIIFRDAAILESEEAFDFYERRQPGLGVQFTNAVQSRLNVILANPLRFAVVDLDIREADVLGFPFCIYYVALPRYILVLSVFHTSRDPDIWKGRR